MNEEKAEFLLKSQLKRAFCKKFSRANTLDAFLLGCNNSRTSTWDSNTIEAPTLVEGSSSTYEIHTAAQLAWLAKQTTFPAKNTYILKTNIDLAYNKWAPIGDETSPFRGVFDGNDYRISGVSLYARKHIGLFGYICGTNTKKAIVKNLKIEISRSYLKLNEQERIIHAGALAGYAQYAEFNNISVKGKELNAHALYVGGIIGQLHSANITNSSSTIGVETNPESRGKGYAGGIAGYSDSEIISCFTEGDIKATNGDYNSYAGGIAGFSSGKIRSCYSTGNINIIRSYNAYAGGIVGFSNNKIESCYSIGNIETYSTTNDAGAGGIAGVANYIANCYATGNIQTKTFRGLAAAGGIVGDGITIGMCAAMNETVNAKGYYSKAGRISGVDVKSFFLSNVAYKDMNIIENDIAKSVKNDEDRLNGLGHSLSSLKRRSTYANLGGEWATHQVWDFAFWRYPKLKMTNNRSDDIRLTNYNITASSTLQNSEKYSINNIFDNTWRSWAEGVPGNGIGQSFSIDFDEDVKLKGFYLKNGFGQSDYYHLNNRVKAFEILINNNESVETIAIIDSPEFENYAFDKQITCSRITFKIADIYPGSKWNDTCVAELIPYMSKDTVSLYGDY